MNWKHLLISLEGRIGKKSYWIGMLVLIAAQTLGMAATGGLDWTPGEPLLTTSGTIVSVILLWPMLAVGAKRWHDHDRSGWFNLLYFIPIVNLVALIWNGITDGTPGNNRFGGVPKD